MEFIFIGICNHIYWNVSHHIPIHTLKVCAHSERQRVRATNYPFAKLMEIAESVPTGRVRVLFSSHKILNFYDFTRAL